LNWHADKGGEVLAWAQLPLQTWVRFSAGSAKYHGDAPAVARQYIIDNFAWIISDGRAEYPLAPTLSYIPSLSTTGNIILYWSHGLGASTYKIYRSESFISTIFTATLIASNITELNYTDDNLSFGWYYYVVTAWNDAGDSPISNCEGDEVISVPHNPQYLIAHGEEDYISLSWDIPGNGGFPILEYRIFRSVNGMGDFIYLANTTTNSLNDTTVLFGRNYYY